MRNTFKQTSRILRYISFVVILLIPFGSVLSVETLPDSEIDMDAITTGSLYIGSAGNFVDAPIHASALEISISGVVSKVKLTQSFNNDSTDWVEGHYVFPLPDQAAVNSMIIRIGEREIIGSIKEKRQAEKQYEQAVRAGHAAGLVKQHRPNLFSTKFANIPPGESIEIELVYIQTVKYEDDQYSIRVPLTQTPRYTNSLVTDVAAITPPQIEALNSHSNQNIDHGVEISSTLFGDYDLSSISSPSHPLAVNPTTDGATIELADQAFLDRDFILEWQDNAIAEPGVQAFLETVAGDEYLLATIMPPTDNALIPELPRELVLIIDTSGSMGGVPIEAAKAALLDALDGLTPSDSFTIIEFNSDYSTLFNKPQPASAKNIEKAKRFTRRLAAGGGTEMMRPLKAALGYSDSDLLRQVVFITDGSVGYETHVVESVKDNLGQSRLFTVGIGSAPNQWFMRKVATAGRGTHHFISDVSDVQTEMSALLAKLESPALTNLSVTFNGGTAEIFPNPIPDLYANEPIVVAAKLNDAPTSVNVTGQWGDQMWNSTFELGDTPNTDTGLSTLWARYKIESLEDKQRSKSDPDYYRSLILRTALDHQILSQHTAFLAVDTAPIRDPNDPLIAKKVPNLIPAGTQMKQLVFPQGSAGIDTLLLLSFLASLVALVILFSNSFNRALEQS